MARLPHFSTSHTRGLSIRPESLYPNTLTHNTHSTWTSRVQVQRDVSAAKARIFKGNSPSGALRCGGLFLSPWPKMTRTVVSSFQVQKAPVPTDEVVPLSSNSSTLHVESEHLTPRHHIPVPMTNRKGGVVHSIGINCQP